MKHTILLGVVCLLISHSLFAQFSFEPGYLILESGMRQTCLILNKDWRDNPTKIQWKANEDSPVQNASIEDLQGFGIDGFSEYVKATLPIDQSSVELTRLSEQREPEWEIQTTLLKTLIRGPVSLYSHRKGDTERYFIQQGEDSIHQLVYKYFAYKQNYLMYNNQFRHQLQQLPGAADCFNVLYYEELECRQRTLIKHMMDYVECRGVEPDFVFKKPPVALRLGVETGAGYTNMTQQSGNRLASQIAPVIGLNAELIPPFGRDRIIFFLNLTGRIVRSNSDFALSRIVSYPSALQHQAIETAFGLRVYFPLKQNYLYLELGVVNEAGIDSRVRLDYGNGNTRTFKISPEFSILGGVGYKAGRFYVNARYYTPREFLLAHSDASANMTVVSLRVGYYLLQTK